MNNLYSLADDSSGVMMVVFVTFILLRYTAAGYCNRSHKQEFKFRNEGSLDIA